MGETGAGGEFEGSIGETEDATFEEEELGGMGSIGVRLEGSVARDGTIEIVREGGSG